MSNLQSYYRALLGRKPTTPSTPLGYSKSYVSSETGLVPYKAPAATDLVKYDADLAKASSRAATTTKWLGRAGKVGKVGAGLGLAASLYGDGSTILHGGLTHGWTDSPDKARALGNAVAVGVGTRFGGAWGGMAAGTAWDALTGDTVMSKLSGLKSGDQVQSDYMKQLMADPNFSNWKTLADTDGNAIGFTAEAGKGKNRKTVTFDGEGTIRGGEKIAAAQPLAPADWSKLTGYKPGGKVDYTMPAEVLANLQGLDQQRTDAMKNLGSRYDSQLADLKKNYNFNETAAEQATLATLMAGYKSKYDTASTTINGTYDGLTKEAKATAATTRTDRDANTAAVKDIWANAAQQAAASQSYAQGAGDSLSGGDVGANLTTGTDANAQQAIASLAAQGAEAATAANATGNDAVNTADSHVSTLGQQRGSSLDWLTYDYDNTRNDAETQHASDVAARIAQDQAQYKSLVEQLAQQRLADTGSLDAEGRNNALQIAQMKTQWAQGQYDRQAQMDDAWKQAGWSYNQQNAQNDYTSAASGQAASGQAQAFASGDYYSALVGPNTEIAKAAMTALQKQMKEQNG